MAKPKIKDHVNEKMLSTFLTNLDYAIFNNETIDVAGGVFSPKELKNLKLALENRYDLINHIQHIRNSI